MKSLPSRIATEEELSLVHTPNHVNSMKGIVKREDLHEAGDKFNSVYFHPSTFECATVSAGSVLQVVDEVLNGISRSGIAIVRPPGELGNLVSVFYQKQRFLQQVIMLNPTSRMDFVYSITSQWRLNTQSRIMALNEFSSSTGMFITAKERNTSSRTILACFTFHCIATITEASSRRAPMRISQKLDLEPAKASTWIFRGTKREWQTWNTFLLSKQLSCRLHMNLILNSFSYLLVLMLQSVINLVAAKLHLKLTVSSLNGCQLWLAAESFCALKVATTWTQFHTRWRFAPSLFLEIRFQCIRFFRDGTALIRALWTQLKMLWTRNVHSGSAWNSIRSCQTLTSMIIMLRMIWSKELKQWLLTARLMQMAETSKTNRASLKQINHQSDLVRQDKLTRSKLWLLFWLRTWR